MKKINSNLLIKILLLQILIVLITFTNAHAYIGLGPLLPMLGTIIAYIFIGIISIFGIIIYPLRILIKKNGGFHISIKRQILLTIYRTLFVHSLIAPSTT